MYAAGSVLARFATQSPVYLVWVVGMVLAVAYWKRSPKSAAFALAGLLILLGVSFVGVWLDVALPVTLARRTAVARTGALLTIIAFVRSLVSAGAYGLLLAAIFVDRPRI